MGRQERRPKSRGAEIARLLIGCCDWGKECGNPDGQGLQAACSNALMLQMLVGQGMLPVITHKFGVRPVHLPESEAGLSAKDDELPVGELQL